MTMRERILAVVTGREHDRVPFAQYDGIAAPNQAVWDLVGRANMGVLRWSGVHRCEYPRCRFEAEPTARGGLPGTRTTLVTPAGCLVEERYYEPAYGSSSIARHYVREPRDYTVLAALLRDAVVVDDTERFLRDERDMGDDGVAHVAIDRTPYQQLWVQWVSLEDLAAHLVDCPERVHECVDLMAGIARRVFDIVRRAPLPYVVFPDNITAPAIGPRYFREHAMPLYAELADMLADRGTPIYVHMDGDLKPLWSSIGESRVDGLDSLSPPPDNDTAVGAAADMWPRMRLGVNFPSSVHLQPANVARASAERILAEAGHTGRLQIQVSENVPAGAWRTSYPAIVDAVTAFGRP